MYKYIQNFILSSLLATLFLTNTEVLAITKPEIIERTKNAVVTIQTRISIAAYTEPSSHEGTGFVVDKTQGLIVTNRHVTGQAAVGDYRVTFFNGQEAEAKLVYYDLWQDFAVLKIDPGAIAASVGQIAFSSIEPVVGQEIFIVGNNEGKGFSFHQGHISDIFSINGDMSEHSYIMNLNSAGGSSGSPVVNDKGEAIALNYGGGESYGIALKAHYIIKALAAINQNSIPKRQHIGAHTQLYSLDHAVKYRNFPKEIMKQYVEQHPQYRSQVIQIQRIIKGSSAQQYLQVGDIIWAINNKHVGANLYILDDEMDKSSNNKVTLSIYRNAKLLEIEVPVYSVNDNKIEQMINFGGATFFMADDYFSSKSGISLKALSIATIQQGSSFSNIKLSAVQAREKNTYRLQVLAMENMPVENLNTLHSMIPQLLTKKFITMTLSNNQPYWQHYNWTVISDHSQYIADITLDDIDTAARIIKYIPASLNWASENIIQ